MNPQIWNSPRPWHVPGRPWLMAQTWNDLLFAHWSVPPDMLRPMLPDGLQLDTFADKAWVGIVPFHMTDIHLRGVPPAPFTSAFPELNVRTYVTHGDKPGVWFFSLDAMHLAAVEVARATYNLPYFHAQMHTYNEGTVTHYYSRRRDWRAKSGAFIGRYRPVSETFHADEGTLEYWLTARFALYAADRNSIIYRGEIAHTPWALQIAEAEIELNTVAQSHGITLSNEAPLLHFSKRLEVAIWSIERA
jgi:uncharacterized protein YqjF (DUF2071 family)